MIVKNVLSQEYPFLEAIAQALQICDEFLISDGYSTDGTYEVLVEISQLNSKIKIYRDRWPPLNKLAVLKEVTNTLRKRCSGKYIFYLQANEIIHEKALKSLLNPLKLLQYLARGIIYTYANVPSSSKFTRAVSLPKPIFRYWCVSLSGFCKKLKIRQEFKDFDYRVDGEKPRDFLTAAKILKKIYLKNNLDVPTCFSEVPLDEHPRIMRDLLREGVYRIRDEVKEIIRAN
jgi:glycosyltransferase involved in cell wall biosynthesis